MKEATAPIYNIYYNESEKYVVMEWTGYSTSKQFKEGTEAMLKTLVENGATKVLADVKEMTIISMEDQHWIETNFAPRAFALGFRTIAIVKPKSYFNAVAIETVSFKVNQGKVTVNIFDNRSDAVDWLKSFGGDDLEPSSIKKDTPIYNVYFDPESSCVIMDWAGYATSAQFREGTEKMLATLIKHNASKVLANVRNMTLIGLEDQKWVENDFLPRAISSGFKAIALVKPLNYFNAVAIESVSYKVANEIVLMNIFEEETAARLWLSTLKL